MLWALYVWLHKRFEGKGYAWYEFRISIDGKEHAVRIYGGPLMRAANVRYDGEIDWCRLTRLQREAFGKEQSR